MPVDIPILAVLLLFYIGGAATNMTIFQLNNRRGHKFIPSVALFGFCMSRIATCSLRMAWATHPDNARLVVAANIFTNVGVLVAYIVLMVLAVRMFRATQPDLGWKRTFDWSIKALYILLALAIMLLIAFVILSVYTRKPSLLNTAVWIERAGILFMVIFDVITLLLYALSAFLPRPSNSENFGSGSMASKFLILGVALFFVLFIVGFRMGALWAPARPISDPGWWDKKPAFYVIEFGFEIVVVYWLAFTRFDQKFWIPNGSKGPGDFSSGSDASAVDKHSLDESVSTTDLEMRQTKR